jgi:hypothetical protein
LKKEKKEEGKPKPALNHQSTGEVASTKCNLDPPINKQLEYYELIALLNKKDEEDVNAGCLSIL